MSELKGLTSTILVYVSLISEFRTLFLKQILIFGSKMPPKPPTILSSNDRKINVGFP